MQNEERDFSSLRTVSAFDKGDDVTVALNLESEELESFSPSSLLVESLIEQLCRLLEKDTRKWKPLYLSVCEKLHQMRLIDSSYEKEEFEFMRSYYQKALYQLLTIAKSTSINKTLISSATNDSLKISSKGEIQWSRYSNEFEELEYVAKGGFGQVYKAQHKLDRGIYAVKKIYLRYQNVNDFVHYIREVKMLAKLNHPNIVAYKAAWLEPFTRKKRYLRAIEMSDESIEKEDSLEVVFETSQKITEPEVVSSIKTSDNSTFLSGTETSTTSSSREGHICKLKKHLYNEGPNLPEWAILYIQMHLCHQTLRQWLDVQNSSNGHINIETAIDIFTKVVRGVEYIHSQGIVHHDIKPSNVFVSDDLQEVQVGDFGLACSLLTHPSPVSTVTIHDSGLVGTKLYAAPEQLNGYCNPKSDVYSLGIILFELIQPFTTAMERSKVIGQFKAGHIPSDILTTYPLLSKILRETINANVKKRPSSSELLEMLEKMQSLNTQRALAELQETNRRLMKELMEKDQELLERNKENACLRQELQQLRLQQVPYS